jgi:cleavage stimulation factor subunit 2
MAQREKGGRVVFIGNIPYGVSEEQICDIFGRIGAVLNFRLVYDKETGKPKGFGFLEYGDTDAAASAVRNLNGFEIMGRELKVDYSNDNSGNRGQRDGGGGGGDGHGSGRAPPPAHFQMNMSSSMPNGALPPQQGDASSALPQLPPGAPLEPGMTAPDAISRTLNAMQPAQLLDIVSQMKTLSQSDPAKATQLLTQAPQLSYAIFQALLLLGLVDPNIIGQLIQQQQPQPAPPPQQQPPQPTYQQPQYAQPPPQNPYPQQPQQQYNPYPQQHPGYAPTPPAPQPAYQPPPPQPAAPAPQAAGGDQQQQLINQVLAMSRDDIMRLDDAPRNQILALRSQLGHPVS